ncbi:MAG: P-loop NTPase [Ignavibacteriales bacterium]|nr:P-loop NTPase [Ignavibacteriales bacterium]
MTGQAERAAQLTRMQRASVAGTGTLPVIGFFSGKGGTGKTFLAQQAAYAFAQQGVPTLLIDADFQNPNLHIMNNTYPVKTIADVLQGKALLREIVEKVTKNMYCAYGSMEGQADIGEAEISRLLNSARKLTDVIKAIIIDSSAGISEAVIAQTTLQVIVTNPEPTSVMDAYVVAKAIAQIEQAGKRVVIINKCHSFEEGNKAFANLNKAMQHFLHETIPLAGLIPQHPDIYDAIMNQQIFLKDKPATATTGHVSKVVGNELLKLAGIM